MIDFARIEKQKTACSLLFLIENTVRVAMHETLVRKAGVDYFRDDVLPEYEYKEIVGANRVLNVTKLAQERKNTERVYNLRMGYDYPYLWYLDFHVLISLLDVFSDRFFDQMFTNSRTRSDVMYRLQNCLPIRNTLAHNRYISDIDLSELKSLFAILQDGLNKGLVDNFNTIALNFREDFYKAVKLSLSLIATSIEKGEVITKKAIRELTSGFSAVLDENTDSKLISTFNGALSLIQEYNRLPRKPGAGPQIEAFRRTSGIKDVVLALHDSIGV